MLGDFQSLKAASAICENWMRIKMSFCLACPKFLGDFQTLKAARAIGLLLFLLVAGCESQQRVVVFSPDQRLKVTVEENAGELSYSLSYDKNRLIESSRLGFEMAESNHFSRNFSIENVVESKEDSSWQTKIGENEFIRSHYHQTEIHLKQEKSNQKLILTFRVFDDGIGFRYEIPEQKGVDALLIARELTEFNVAKNPEVWSLPVDYDSYEKFYQHGDLASLDSTQTPVTFRYPSGTHLSIHEAALVDYASMTLIKTANGLEADLVPWPDGIKVKRQSSLITPWRTVQVADDAAGLVASSLILNLNEPSKIEDTSWIKPMKYMGIWWNMHLGINSWNPGDIHGATTARTKRLMDFAAEHGFDGVLVEGWNEGWEEWGNWSLTKPNPWSFTKAYPDFNLEEVVRYGKEKNVALISHNETEGYVDEYEEQMEEAYSLYEKLGIPAIKTGYVSPIKNGQFHHGQWMVNHYQKVIETAAAHKISILAHESIKPTGLRRTWPNFLSRESARGQEYNAPWSATGNPPDHTTILPFTRMLAGPMDFTPGVFQLTFEKYGINDKRVNTTLAKQLALYVVINSPVQMASDLPENYQGQPAFQFIKDIAVNWQQTHVLNGSIGDFITTARKERDGERWFIGSITDEEARTVQVELDFLDKGVTYLATIYKDGPTADWQKAPYDLEIETKEVIKGEKLNLALAAGGGQAIMLVPKS